MKLVPPDTLAIGDKYRLTGAACTKAEREDKSTYEVVNKDTACVLGAHLIVKGDDGVEREVRIMPWVKVYKIEEHK